MLIAHYFPRALSKARLDQYLARGWFRSGASMFRTQVLCLDGGAFAVVNIRLKLTDFRPGRNLRRVIRRCKAVFRVEHGYPSISPEKELLYAGQKTRFKGYLFETLEEFLDQQQTGELFDTREIRVYHGERLVALSYVDMGEEGIASIMGLYDPAYAQYSLGLYTMTCEAELAISLGMKYFYPGYVLLGHSGFDYKLRLGPMQFHDWGKRWRNWAELDESQFIMARIDEAMQALETVLQAAGIPHQTLINPFFTLGYMNVDGEDYLGAVKYIVCYPDFNRTHLLAIEYLDDTDQYGLIRIRRNDVYLPMLEASYPDELRVESPWPHSLLIHEETLVTVDEPAILAAIIPKLRSHFYDEI